MKFKEKFALYLRNFIFGVEDSLVSTVGLVSGIAVAGVPKSTILLSGVVLIFVEAFSMATGSYLSQESSDEYMYKNKISRHNSIVASFIMFFSYFISGFIPLIPYMIFSVETALVSSIVLSCLALFFLGVVSGKFSKGRPFRVGIRMFVLGGIAILVGVTVGTLLS